MKMLRYVTGVPKAKPEGTVLVHNFRPGNPDRKVSDGGFRIFLATFDDDENEGHRAIMDGEAGWSIMKRQPAEHYELNEQIRASFRSLTVGSRQRRRMKIRLACFTVNNSWVDCFTMNRLH